MTKRRLDGETHRPPERPQRSIAPRAATRRRAGATTQIGVAEGPAALGERLQALLAEAIEPIEPPAASAVRIRHRRFAD